MINLKWKKEGHDINHKKKLEGEGITVTKPSVKYYKGQSRVMHQSSYSYPLDSFHVLFIIQIYFCEMKATF